jgi:hypothetical protein
MTIPEEYGTGIVDVGAGKVWRGSGGRQQQVAPYEAWTGLDRLAARGGRRLAHLSRTSETLRKARHQAGPYRIACVLWIRSQYFDAGVQAVCR